MAESTSSSEVMRITLAVQAGADADECDYLTHALRTELIDLGVDRIDFVPAGELPPGAKGAEPLALGALVLAVLPTLLPRLVEYLQSWTMRAENRRIRVKTQVADRSIELEFSPAAISPDEMEKFAAKLTGALLEKAEK